MKNNCDRLIGGSKYHKFQKYIFSSRSKFNMSFYLLFMSHSGNTTTGTKLTKRRHKKEKKKTAETLMMGHATILISIVTEE